MSGAKFALLLVVGGIAGAAFAVITTGAMPRFSQPQSHRSATLEDNSPAGRSWLDEGLSALNSPAWPFGRGSDDAGPPMPPEPQQDYAPYGYGPPDDYDDGAWERRQYGSHAPYQGEGYAAEGSQPAPDRSPAPSPAAPRADAAADAAARAADAAQDVLSAENTP
ncbi:MULTISPECIES: hypothetical protein [Novosphingobium]|uniref:hypothetical protein n=1 Tax=Novosphingobium TaxID=165696 RepID=UPI0022F28202|nr:hypothetical protein [Novosphingobium resinovorum]GLK43539.1 hypothetical protein GCM10017612_14580 [Novosphingobium resinovorum]